MKKIITSILFYLLFYTVNAQYKEVRKLSSLEGISVATSLNVIYIESDKNEIVLESEKKEYINLILTEIKNGILSIKYKPNTSIRTSKPNKVTVYSNSRLKVLKATSSANLHIDAPINTSEVSVVANSSGKVSARHIKTDKIDIEVTSSGKFDSYIQSSSVVIDASSSGRITLAGQIGNANAKMSSSATIDLTKTTINDLICRGSSSAKLLITSSSTLHSDLSSSATLSYSQVPKKIIQNKTASSGRIYKRQ